MARVREEGIEEKILDAAFKVFGERGFADATTREIADAVGLSSASLYTYFPNKEALFRAAVQKAWESFKTELQDIAALNLNRKDRSELLLERGFDALLKAFPLIKGIFLEACRLDLIEDNLDQVCSSIAELLAPDNGKKGTEASEADRQKKNHLMLRVIVLGILASASLATQPASGEITARLREAMSTLIARASGYDESAGQRESM
jgi:AcrR family transcriptional regulator